MKYSHTYFLKKPEFNWLRLFICSCFFLSFSPIALLAQNHVQATQEGLEYYRNGNYESALESFQKAIQFSPQIAELYVYRGQTYTRLEDYPNAESDFSIAIRLNPRNAQAFMERGALRYYRTNQLEAALADFNQLLNLEPNNAYAHNYRGLVHLTMKNYDQSIQDFDRALSYQPDNPTFISNRGQAKYGNQDYEGAQADLNRSIEDSTYLGHLSYFYRSLLHMRKADWEAALVDLKKAIQLNPSSGSYHANAGDMLEKLGRREEACQEWNQALGLGHAAAKEKFLANCGKMEAYDYVDIPTTFFYVRDSANLLQLSDRARLEKRLKSYDDSTSTEISIVTISSLKGRSLETYAAEMAQGMGMGQQSLDNGLLILVSVGDRKVRLETGYGLEAILTDLAAKNIIDYKIIPNFKAERHYQGLDEALTAIFGLLSGEFSVNDLAQTAYRSGNTSKGHSNYSTVILVLVLIVVFILIIAFLSDGSGGGGGSTYTRGGSSWSSSSSSWGSSSSSSWSSGSSSSSWSSGGSSSFGGGSFGGGGASGSW